MSLDDPASVPVPVPAPAPEPEPAPILREGKEEGTFIGVPFDIYGLLMFTIRRAGIRIKIQG